MMSTQYVRFAALSFVLAATMFAGFASAIAQRSAERSVAGDSDGTGDLASLRESAYAALRDGKYDAAIAAADKMVEVAPKDEGVIGTVADLYLRGGQIAKATTMFNRFAKLRPEQLPYLWQRGIALYFDGAYEEAAKQFEIHRTVNPNDVENAAWHFLCVAKANSPEQARQLVLPAPGDPRIPMAEVLEMLSSGETALVTARVERVSEGTAARRSAEFYGDFYLGLYADALGDRQAALKHLKRAAEDAPRNYMGDVARVYAKFLNR